MQTEAQKRTIVFDLDGVLWDDITAVLRMRMRTTKTFLAQAYCEFVVTALSFFPKTMARRVEKLKKSALDGDAIAAARQLHALGYDILVRTSNDTVDSNKLKKSLGKKGVPAQIDKPVCLSGKAAQVNGRMPIVVEDSTVSIVASLLRAIMEDGRHRDDATFLLVRKDYNRILGWLISGIDRNIVRLDSARDAPAAISSMLRGQQGQVKLKSAL
ncbi:MAG: hypothetical protein LVQ95_00620 [Candidatus Micrarchaeales archaeon]|nr:hypothetical protein [Candidatus Micrarchaeales archaeon]